MKNAKNKQICVIGKYCSFHKFIHGKEAEELRKEITDLVNSLRGSWDRNEQFVHYLDLEELLEKVDARDSVAYLEKKHKLT